MARSRGAAGGVLVWAGLVVLAGAALAQAQGDPERVRAAKALLFDRKYAEARQAWEAVRDSSAGQEKAAATYWLARCSEGLGENERAFKEYGSFLALAPTDPTLVEEARTSRVGLAAKLYPSSTGEYGPLLRQALADTNKTVRYYAALRVADLSADIAREAVPVLRQIVEHEKDPDLVDRAKIKLWRLDPSALQPSVTSSATSRAGTPPPSGHHDVRWVRVRITEKGGTRPKVAINLPLALAEMVFKSLPDDVKTNLRKKGYDADTFWDTLRKLGPSEIISIEDEDGEHIQIWTEE